MAQLYENAISKLATVTSINAKTTGATTLYTVPVGKTCVLTSVSVRVTAFTEGSKVTQCAFQVGGNATSYDDFYVAGGVTIAAVNQTAQAYPTVETAYPIYAAESLIKINITTGSDADVETWAVDVFGYLI